MRLLNVVLKGDTLVFYDKDNSLYTVLASEEEKSFFKKRKILKAIINNDSEEFSYKIIRVAQIHQHSDYSFLDGAVSVKNMAKKLEACGAITDHGNMCGALSFYKEMHNQGKLPLIGQEFYCEDIDGNMSANHLVLIAKNNNGYKNLMKLSSMSYDNFYKKPHISYKMLEQYKEGLICTSACIAGELSRSILRYRDDKTEENKLKVKKIINFFKNTFGEDFYIEIQKHGIEGEEFVNKMLIGLSKRYSIKYICTTDSHYLNKEDREVQELLLCINTKKTFADPDRFKFNGDGYHVHTSDEMEDLFADCIEGLDNTLEIAEKCTELTIETGKYYLPKFPIKPPFADEHSYLEHLVKNGFIERYKPLLGEVDTDTLGERKRKNGLKKKYWERAKYELSVIKQMGFSGYFLIVWDFLNYCLNNNIPIGPGRGSGAGSIVLYCLHVTDVDPMQYNLLFERFLNPDRISMPDIDSDISQEDRKLVIDYVKEVYGVERVSQIVAFGTLAAKLALEYTLKIVGLYSASEARAITSYIPSTHGITLEAALKESKDLRNWANKNKDTCKLMKIAMSAEGLNRNISVHACGVVIGQDVISEMCPTMSVFDRITGEKTTVTQYEGPECEEIGCLKMDFLGLRTLDVIEHSIRQINKAVSNLNISQYNIPIDDPKVYSFLEKGFTDGVFQFESAGMTNLLKQMFADVSDSDTKEKGKEYFERMIAAVSLYRPGPMDEIPNYISAMHSGIIHYDHPMLEDILSNTYGILVYQEQIMFAVRKLAGFSAGQADTVRKAMGKKKEAIMKEYGEYFLHGSVEKGIKGCVANGIPEKTAKLIWDKMAKFASYAFNKSHATCYAMLGVRTAWLSYYYPLEFTTSILNSYIGKTDKISKTINACNKRKLKLFNPDVNLSDYEFKVVTCENIKGIRFGLAGIKGVGDQVVNAIIKERNDNGFFKSFDDFLIRVSDFIQIDSLESLIKSGALDCFKGTRASKLENIKLIKLYISKIKELKLENDNTEDKIFGNTDIKLTLPNVEEYSDADISLFEEEVLGFFITHPIKRYSSQLEKYRKKGLLVNISDIELILSKDPSDFRKKRFCAGLVKNKELIQYVDKKTNKPKKLLKFTLDDGTGTMSCVFFDDKAIKYDFLLKNNLIVYISGTVKRDDFGLSCSGQTIEVLSRE